MEIQDWERGEKCQEWLSFPSKIVSFDNTGN